MRLLQCDDKGRYTLTSDLHEKQIPPYAILSHTWGKDEVIFADLARGDDKWKSKAGFEKIRFCGDQARQDGLRYFWVDTCCINKAHDAIELQTAINSMFRWYRDAAKCYVYLSDVSSEVAGWEEALRNSKWFRRGWTLQELLAPSSVTFFSKEGVNIGTKESLGSRIRDITGLPAGALDCSSLFDFPLSERETWIQHRETTVPEDMAYSLLGVFGELSMPTIYGEGRTNAFRRLREVAERAAKGARHDEFFVPFNLSNVPEIQRFVARKRELAELRRSLTTDDSRHVAVLQGLGGIGKTQLAVAYAKRYREHYSAVFWLTIKDEISIKQSFIEVARQILQEHPNVERLSSVNLQGSHEEIIQAVKTWLGLKGNTRWLLIYDNYDNPSSLNHMKPGGVDIHQFLPRAYQGSIIVTTRSSQVDLGNSLRMKKMESIDDGLEILASTSGRDNLRQDPDGRRLVEKLDGLPLAIATAGAYLRRVSTSCGAYLRLYEESWEDLHATTPSLGSYGDRTLCSTWQLSYMTIQQRHELAERLLRFWAYFDNQDIWYELLKLEPRTERLLSQPWLIELTRNELSFNEAVGVLHDYGLVEVNTTNSNTVESAGYSMHSCVHSWVMNVLNKNWDPDHAKLAVCCIAGSAPQSSAGEYWLLQKRILSHARKCRSYIQNNGWRNMEWAFHGLGFLYKNLGELQDAEDMYMLALGGKENAQKSNARYPDYTLSLETLKELGNLYSCQKRLPEAEEMYLRSLRGKQKVWRMDHAKTLNTVHNLGTLYFQQEKWQEAEEMYSRALRGYEKVWGSESKPTLSVINHLGELHFRQGDMQKAEEMYLRALDGREVAYGLDHTVTLSTVTNLGILYQEQRKFQEAGLMYSRALQGYEKAVGVALLHEYKPALAVIERFGPILMLAGRPAEAQEMYNRAIDGLRLLYGPSSPYVRNLQSVLLSMQNTSVSTQQSSSELPGISSRSVRPLPSREGQLEDPAVSKIRKSLHRLGIALTRRKKD